MKQYIKKIIMAFLIIAIIAPAAKAQDVSINILMSPGTIAVGQTSQIQVDIDNNDPGALAVPSYKLRPLISVPSTYLLITGVTGLPAGWSICSNNGSSIRLSNGTDNMPAGTRQTFFIDVQGIAVTPGVSIISSTMSFGGGTAGTACNAGAQTAGNLPANDNSSSGFQVTAPLPLSLLSFSADVSNCSTLLKWQTAQESNTDKFIVEQSADGRSFTAAATVAAAGFSSSIVNYQTPVAQQQSTTYYRLRMLDKDATGNYSNVIKVSNPCAGHSIISVYPNPVTDRFSIQLPQGPQRIMTVYDNLGQKMMSVTLNPGTVYSFNTKQWSAGMYSVVVLEDGQKVYTQKIIKQ